MLTSDEEILNATLTALQIFGRSNLGKNKKNISITKSDNADMKYELSESSSVVPSSLTVQSSESLFANSRSCDVENNFPDLCSKNCPEFQEAIEGLAVIDLMYNFYHEQQCKKKEKGIHFLMESLNDAVVPSTFKLNVEKMKSVLDHITTISTEGAKLRQVLRSSVLNEFWKINVDYHKSVVRFFTLSQEITKDIQDFIRSIEKSKEHNQNRTKSLHILETKLLAELHENLDILTEFRNYVISSVN